MSLLLQEAYTTIETKRQEIMKRLVILLVVLATSANVMFSQYSLTYEENNYGDFYSAISNETVEDIKFNDPEMYLNRGMELAQNHDLFKAISAFSEAIDLNEEYALAYDKRGIAHTKVMNYHRALKDFNRAIKIDPEFAEAYNHRGIVNYCLRNYVQSINDYTRAITLDPEYGKAYYNRAITRLMIDDEKGAYQDLQKALEYNFKEAEEVIKEFFE
ncbi:MAG: tetratricopeptide repeat protein [bacterium]